jgi:sialate O-acetylesterase
MKTYIRYSLLALAALLVLSLVVCGGLAVPSQLATGAALSVPTMFSDHAVLQRDIAVPVWGTGPTGETVTVSFNGQVKNTTVDGNGDWSLNLDPMSALATPSDMVITAGVESITVSGVQVGEVWLGSGQSNMYRPLSDDADAATAIPDSGNYNIRLFNVAAGSPDDVVWQVCNPDTSPAFSAVLFYFGRHLAQNLSGVPIGLLHAATSATAIETWSTACGNGSNYLSSVKPMQPYAFRGATWYQGEWDARNANDSSKYYWQLPALIDEWRTDWGQGNFPFYVVQMPRMGLSQIHMIRDAELQTAFDDPDVMISVHLDSEPVDVHPPAKEPFGRRLAYLARKYVYGQTLVESGPIYDIAGSSVQGNQVAVAFDHVGGGLQTGGSSLAHWEIADAPGGSYVSANAQIVGDTVVVSSASVPNPACVRYAYTQSPSDITTFLYNAEGLPASPIREMCPAAGPTPTPSPTDTPGPTPTPGPTDTPAPTATPGGTPEMHVEDIHTTDAAGTPQDVFSATNKEVIYYRALIHDQFNSPVDGALVTTDIIWPDDRVWTTIEETTGANGWALFSKGTTKPQQKGTYHVDVTDVTKSGATYNPAANVKDVHYFEVE